MIDIAVVILTYNEERHIGRALDSIQAIAREIFIIDSYSTDRTVEIAEAKGAIVLKNKFVNYAKQFEWGLANASITSKWVMRLDADEIIEPDLVSQLEHTLPSLDDEVAGINLNRKHIFMGRWIRYGGRYPLILLRIWRHGQGRIEQRWMDEHMVVWGGRTVTLAGGFSDHNLNDITFFTDKHNKYATREAIDVINRKYGFFKKDEVLSSKTASRQASIKRLAKERIYNNLPFWIGPALYFLFRYFIQLGFLDGQAGLVYHFLQGGWYRFLVGVKVAEYEALLGECLTSQEKFRRLEELTGHKLSDEPER